MELVTFYYGDDEDDEDDFLIIQQVTSLYVNHKNKFFQKFCHYNNGMFK